ncbi:MAG: O-antigen ligase family protein [Polyangia bacterium]
MAGCRAGGGPAAGVRVNSAAEAERSAGAARTAAAVLRVTIIVVMLAYVPALAAPFVEIKLAALMLGGGLSAAAWLWARVESGSGRLDAGIAVAGAAVLLTTVLSAAVAAARGTGVPYAGGELARWGAAAGVALGTALVVASGRRERLVDAIQIGAALVAAIGLAQHLGLCPLPIPSISVPGSTFGNRNIAAEAMAAALPFALARRGRVAGALVILELVFLAVARTRGAWIGGAAGVAAFLAVRRARVSWRAVAAGTIAAVAIVAAAALPGRRTPHDAHDPKRYAPAADVVREGLSVSSPVARTRLGLWRRAWAMYWDAPLFGVGPGNFAVRFPRYAEPGAADEGVLSPSGAPKRVHDDLLERLTETGPLGLLALLALYAAAAVAAHRARGAAAADADDLGFAAACAGSLAAVAGCGLTGFPLAMPATVLLFGVAVGGLAARTDGPGRPVRRPARRPPALRAGAAVVAAALVVAAVVWPARRLAASLFLGRAQRALAGTRPEDAARALADLARAARAAPRDFDVALRTAYAASRASRPADAIAAAQRALAVEPDSPNGWEALAQGRLEAGDPAGAAAAADRALALLHAYPGALYTRAAASRALGDAGAAARARAALAALAAANPQASWLLGRLDGR